VLEDPVGDSDQFKARKPSPVILRPSSRPSARSKPKFKDVIVCGNEAAVDWKLHLTTTTGKHITIDVWASSNLTKQASFKSVREFWDLAAFLAQLQG
jgi:hypothetical protein